MKHYTVRTGIISLFASLWLVGCGGGGGGGSSANILEPASTDVTFDRFGNSVSGTFVFTRTLPAGATETYEIASITANGCDGTATFPEGNFTLSSVTKSKEIDFNLVFGEKCITDKITIAFNRIIGISKLPYSETIKNDDYDASKVTTILGSDPLYTYQWHLKNTGQSVGVITPAISGNDINVEGVWGGNITGKGVRVAVIDTGVDMFHPDLKDNIIADSSYNYHTASNNPTPARVVSSSDGGGYYDYPHGTAVAGLIAAKGWNGIGTRGVAPDAKLISFNALEIYAGEAAALYAAHEIPNLLSDADLQLHRLNDALVRNIETIDIYSNSWGSSTITLANDYPSTTDFDNQLKYGVVNGRDGNGSIYIKSAGNGRLSCSNINVESCAMDNFEQMQTNGYFIVVGASGSDGRFAPYSTPGSNLLVNAPGGGVSNYYLKPDEQMIVTTDMVGKARGYDAEIPYETSVAHFNVEGNENYDYTQVMNGTSAAAPIVSGVVALMLEANPSLTWRDIRLILARTAIQNDATNSSWNTNAAGLHFNNNYGFGRIDAQGAVAMARTFSSVGTYIAQRVFTAETTNDTLSSVGTATNALTISQTCVIEHAQVTLTLKNTPTQYVSFSFDNNDTNISQTSMHLFPGNNIVTLNLIGDANESNTSVSLVDFPAQSTTIPVFSNYTGTDVNSSEQRIVTIPTEGNYAFLVTTNSTGQWTLNIQTPRPDSIVSNRRIALVSPSGTRSILVDAPNGLPQTDEYNQTRLSTVQFMDESCNGSWTLNVEDVNGSSFAIDRWKLEVRGR